MIVLIEMVAQINVHKFKKGDRVIFTPTKYLNKTFPKLQEIGIVVQIDIYKRKGILVIFDYGYQWCNVNNLSLEPNTSIIINNNNYENK